MQILITGANGFVAHYLTAQLLQQGHSVLATGKGPCRLPFNGEHFQYRDLDFTDAAAVTALFQQYTPVVVVHCGALSKPDECEQNREEAYRVNVTGTQNLLQAATSHTSFFVFLSTDFVFDGTRGMYSEEDERKAVNYYGQTKIEAEDAVMQYPFPWSIVRTVLVYGKPLASRQNLLTGVAASLKEGKSLKIFCDQYRTPTYVEDLASALVTIIEKKAAGVYHISGSDGLSPYEMALAVAQYLKLDESLVESVVEEEFEQPARRPPITGFVLQKAERDLGYKPVLFEEGLKRTFS